MKKLIAKDDIYNDKGILLIRKGREFRENAFDNLKNFRLVELFSIIEKDENVKSIEDSGKYLIYDLNISDEKIMEFSVEIINEILHNLKDKSIKLCIDSLSNYVSWVYSHSINVSLISVMLAFKFGLNKKNIEEIAIGSIIHDIGKILIPKDIIEKPGKLTQIEFDVVKKHSELGYSIIEKLDIPEVSKMIVLNHHERENGTGYPRGLKKKELSIGDEIVMIADSFDAMTSYRPYKSPMSSKEGIDDFMKRKDEYSLEGIIYLKELMHPL